MKVGHTLTQGLINALGAGVGDEEEEEEGACCG